MAAQPPGEGARASSSSSGSDTFLPLAYCTDVSAIPPETYPRLADLGTLVLDCLRERHHPTHLNLDQAIRTAQEIAARRTWFVHMAHELRHADTDAAIGDETMRLAWDGLVLE